MFEVEQLKFRAETRNLSITNISCIIPSGFISTNQIEVLLKETQTKTLVIA